MTQDATACPDPRGHLRFDGVCIRCADDPYDPRRPDLGDGLRARVAELEQQLAAATSRSACDVLAARAQVAALDHREEGVGCSCGFCVWSVEHVLVMSIREAWPR
jgi:hypothetical protein